MKNLLIIVVFCSLTAAAQQIVPLSERAEISVITCGPSQRELYTAFGHSAFRVKDPIIGIDLAYNYGVFDFNQPNFYLNFAKGFLYYRLGVEDFDEFVYPYIYFNRSVREQVLDLSKEQKQKIFEYLQTNARPENQQYRYDYFYNNCATKIRDVIVDALGENTVHFDGAYIKTEYSIRELTDLYLTEQPWGDLGIDICLGLPMDKTATPYEYMFLPDYVESGFSHATVDNGKGSLTPIVKQQLVINEVREMDSENSLPHPLIFLGALGALAIGLSIFDLRRKKISIWFDITFFAVCGAIGLLLFFLWFFTDHNAAARNLNLLWAFPLHFIAAIAIPSRAALLRKYFGFSFLLHLMLLISWPVLPQLLHYALIPIVIALIARSYVNYKLRGATKYS